MQPLQTQRRNSYFLYDGDLLAQVEVSWFEPAAWRARGQWLGSAQGRGETAFVTDGTHEYVLRHYRRGGVPGKLVRDSYLWTGLENTRVWREWRLTAELFQRGLPVAQPVAARVVRRGLFYRGDLLTVRIPATQSLAQLLAPAPLPVERWRAIGRCIRRFHDAGVNHADLNAHNILLTADAVYVIDFDRGRLCQPGTWAADNLARLYRSLRKLYHQNLQFAFAEADWQALRAGYDGAD